MVEEIIGESNSGGGKSGSAGSAAGGNGSASGGSVRDNLSQENGGGAGSSSQSQDADIAEENSPTNNFTYNLLRRFSGYFPEDGLEQA